MYVQCGIPESRTLKESINTKLSTCDDKGVFFDDDDDDDDDEVYIYIYIYGYISICEKKVLFSA
jgi:hypothetical protein